MNESGRPVRERIITVQILKLERRQALARAERAPGAAASSPAHPGPRAAKG